MKKTIIEILKDISEGKTPPKKILFDDKVYKWNDGVDYENEDGEYVEFLLSQQCICKSFLNEEVEILETEVTFKQDISKIEKLNVPDPRRLINLATLEDVKLEIRGIEIKINTIIDFISKEEK